MYPWEEDPTMSPTDYVIARSHRASDYPASACEALPVVPLAEPLAIDQSARRFAPYPADYLHPDQRATGPYSSDLPLSEGEVDRRHFWNLLISVIPDLLPTVPEFESPPSEPRRILDLACGGMTAAVPLQSYFGGVTYGQSGAAEYIGVDISSSEYIWNQTSRDYPNVQFITADATDLSQQPWAQDPFDVVVIRHPEVFQRFQKGIAATWFKIFKNAAAQLRIGGLLIVTTHRCFEFQGADEVFTALGLTRLYEGQHPYAPLLDAGYMLRGGVDPQRDRFVAIYTREPELAPRAAHDTVQISTHQITARSTAGTPYRVTRIPLVNVLYYEDLTTHQTRTITDPALTQATEIQLATNGAETFVYLATERTSDIMRVNWETLQLEPLSEQPTASDFTYCYKFECDRPRSIRVLGFRVVEQQLVGDAAVIEPLPPLAAARRGYDEKVTGTIFPLR